MWSIVDMVRRNISPATDRTGAIHRDSPNNTQKMNEENSEDFLLSQRKIFAKLVIQSPSSSSNNQKEYELFEGENFIGRNQVCEVSITEKTISSKHAEIDIDISNLTFEIRDLRSSNGTFVENPVNSGRYERLSAIDNRRQISHGSHLRLGKVTCQFLLNDPPAVPTRAIPAVHVNRNCNFETQLYIEPEVKAKAVPRSVLEQETLIDDPMMDVTAHSEDEGDNEEKKDEDEEDDIIESDATEALETQDINDDDVATDDGEDLDRIPTYNNQQQSRFLPSSSKTQVPTPASTSSAFARGYNPILDSATLVDPIIEDGNLSAILKDNDEDENDEKEEEVPLSSVKGMKDALNNDDDDDDDMSQDMMQRVQSKLSKIETTSLPQSNTSTLDSSIRQTSGINEEEVEEEEKETSFERQETTAQHSSTTATSSSSTTLEVKRDNSGIFDTPATKSKPPLGIQVNPIEATPMAAAVTPETTSTNTRGRGRKATLTADSKPPEKLSEKLETPQPTNSIGRKRGLRALIMTEDDENLSNTSATATPAGLLDASMVKNELPATASKDDEEEEAANKKKRKKLSFSSDDVDVPTTEPDASKSTEPSHENEAKKEEVKEETPTEVKKGRGGRKKKEENVTPSEEVKNCSSSSTSVKMEVEEEKGDNTDEVPPPSQPPKRGGRGKTANSSSKDATTTILSSSSSSSSAHTFPNLPIRIMFTKVEESAYTKALKKIPGIEVTNDPALATYCITTKELKRTPKLMIGLNCVLLYVLTDQWITDSAKAGRPLPLLQNPITSTTSDEEYREELRKSVYLVQDDEKEALWDFSMSQTLSRIYFSLDPPSASSSSSSSSRSISRKDDTKIFQNHCLLITADICGVTAPSEQEMSQIITSGGGTWLTSISQYKTLLNGETKGSSTSKGRGRGKGKASVEDEVVKVDEMGEEGKQKKKLIIVSQEKGLKKQITNEMKELVQQSGINAIYTIEVIFKAVLRQRLDLTKDILQQL
eukprot:gene10800-11772_t